MGSIPVGRTYNGEIMDKARKIIQDKLELKNDRKKASAKKFIEKMMRDGIEIKYYGNVVRIRFPAKLQLSISRLNRAVSAVSFNTFGYRETRKSINPAFNKQGADIIAITEVFIHCIE